MINVADFGTAGINVGGSSAGGINVADFGTAGINVGGPSSISAARVAEYAPTINIGDFQRALKQLSVAHAGNMFTFADGSTLTFSMGAAGLVCTPG